ncbi:hypothetical protein U0035_21005 [Niabella yanshanensis]|uniref:DUF3244 domain-containing protein n=1 Tax=Niabella yanshanensis TaxID=577386 RepID=A0ABZ0W4N8_9BACT|nr:hypothetical protein [Niabella yanshanensis]WQD38151.1 hypothetical protein U0035_21005 [Niabella yanshanensis]
MNILSKTKTFVVVFIAILTITSTAAFAGNVDDDKKSEIAYIGNLNESPVYRLSLNNENKETVFVSVADADGNILYNEKVSGTKIVRNYQFDNVIGNDYELTFTISNAKGKTLSSYNVNRSQKATDEIAVSKIK